jgi:hypothetical protein
LYLNLKSKSLGTRIAEKSKVEKRAAGQTHNFGLQDYFLRGHHWKISADIKQDTIRTAKPGIPFILLRLMLSFRRTGVAHGR